jgi:tight adherence protein C
MSFDAPLAVVLPAVAVVVSLLLLFWGLAGIGKKKASAPALETAAERVVDERQLHLQKPALDRFVRPLLRSLARRARRLTPAGWVRALEHRVRLAGSPAAWSVDRVLAAKLLLAIAMLIVSVSRSPRAAW